MSQSLFNITLEKRLLLEQIEANDGELTEELAEALAINQDDFLEKSEGYAYIIQKLNADIEAGQKEIERIGLYVASKQKAKARLEETLIYSLKLFGSQRQTKTGNTVYEAQSGFFKFSTKKSESLEIEDLEEVPEIYLVDVPQPPKPPDRPDKDAIKRDLKLGKEVPGVRIVEKYSLTLK